MHALYIQYIYMRDVSGEVVVVVVAIAVRARVVVWELDVGI